MAPKKLFIEEGGLLALVAITCLVGIKLNLEWVYWWFDMVLHFSGGVCVAMGGISVWFYLFNNAPKNKSKIIWMGLMWVILVGFVWEVFELCFDLASFEDGVAYYTDTSSDLFLDILGGFIGALYSHKMLKNG